jgi:hypothetical protein
MKRESIDSNDDSEDGKRQSIQRFWEDQFKKEGHEEDAIKPNFDIFT